MILASIYYHVFPGEADLLETSSGQDWHQIEGELRLEFTDRPARFVSWGKGALDHAVEVSAQPFFAQELLGSMEMSDHPYWSELIGREVRLAYAAPDRRVLKLATAESQVFLSASHEDGTVYGDSLRVSPLAPDRTRAARRA